jgi:DNA-binding transcriptional regulator YiaG
MAKKTVGKTIADRLAKFAKQLEATSDPVQRFSRDRFTAREVKVADPEPHSPGLVRETRELLNASQPVFAGLLGVSVAALRDWEQGANEPHGAARRLMTAIRLQPAFWVSYLEQLSTPATAAGLQVTKAVARKGALKGAAMPLESVASLPRKHKVAARMASTKHKR